MASQASAPNVRAFDAVSILGFGPPSPEPMPEPQPGEIVLRYGGWSLQDLREARQDGYDEFPWASEKLPAGIYVLRLPILGSNRKTFDNQKTLLLPGEEPAPVVIAASALLSIHHSGQPDPLNGHWTRCKEPAADGFRVALDWAGGGLRVSGHWDGDRNAVLWLSSSRKAR